VGHAFHAGVLHGLAEATGWEPGNASVIVGTSAGAQVAGLVRAGMTASDLTARITGDPLSETGARLAPHYIRPEHGPASRDLRHLFPPSWLGIRRRINTFLRTHPVAHLLAMIPEGRVSLEPQAEGFRRMFPEGWPARELWICTVRLHDGRRVVFGRAGEPVTDVGAAVIASGAVPAVCKPVSIGDHRYVDGGFRTMTSVDLVAEKGLDLVLVSSPMTCEPGRGPSGVTRRVRSTLRRRMEREAEHVRRTGTPVVVLQPTGMQAAAIGLNVMDTERMAAVAVETRKITLERMRDPACREAVGLLISSSDCF